MKKIEQYQCEECKRTYLTPIEAEECEKSHKNMNDIAKYEIVALGCPEMIHNVLLSEGSPIGLCGLKFGSVRSGFPDSITIKEKTSFNLREYKIVTLPTTIANLK